MQPTVHNSLQSVRYISSVINYISNASSVYFDPATHRSQSRPFGRSSSVLRGPRDVLHAGIALQGTAISFSISFLILSMLCDCSASRQRTTPAARPSVFAAKSESPSLSPYLIHPYLYPISPISAAAPRRPPSKICSCISIAALANSPTPSIPTGDRCPTSARLSSSTPLSPPLPM